MSQLSINCAVTCTQERKEKLIQVLRPLLTLRNPFPYQYRISRFKSNLEGLRLRRQSRRDRIALDRIEDRPILSLLSWMHGKCRDQTDVSGEELAIRKVRTSAHARARAVAVVWSAGAVR